MPSAEGNLFVTTVKKLNPIRKVTVLIHQRGIVFRHIFGNDHVSSQQLACFERFQGEPLTMKMPSSHLHAHGLPP